MGNVITPMVVMGWLVFAMLAINPGAFRDGCFRFRRLPRVLQAAGWLLFFPWVAAAGIWQSRRRRAMRLTAVIAIAAATVSVSALLTA